MIYCAEKETIAVDATTGKRKEGRRLKLFYNGFFSSQEIYDVRIIVGCEKSKKWLDDSALAMMLFQYNYYNSKPLDWT